jgi:hypothetical protein
MSESFTQLLAAVEASKPEAEKFFGKGTKAAGTRLRKNMQDIKRLANLVRKEVSDTKQAAVAAPVA